MTGRGRRRAVLAFAVVQILLGTSVLGYRWMTTSTEADVSSALERYRDKGFGPDSPQIRFETTEPASDDPGPPEGDERPEAEIAGAQENAAAAALDRFSAPPQPGVYGWEQEGSEEVGGLSRELPERSVRVVTLDGTGGWVDEHRYSEQHVREVTMGLTEQGVFSAGTKTRISFGPFSGDNAVAFEPPVHVGVFPTDVGQRWEGSFTGPTYGSYTGHTFERTTLRVGEEDLEVWGIEVRMQMHGEMEADVTSRVWVSPGYRMAVKEYHDQKARSGGVSYTGRWTITLLSTQPQR